MLAALSLTKPQNYTQPFKKNPSGAEEEVQVSYYGTTGKLFSHIMKLHPLSPLEESHDPSQRRSGFTGRDLPSGNNSSV